MTEAEKKLYKEKLDRLLATKERPLKEIIDRMLSYNMTRFDIQQILQLQERMVTLAEDGGERNIPAIPYRNALCCYLAFDRRAKLYAAGETANFIGKAIEIGEVIRNGKEPQSQNASQESRPQRAD